MESSHTCTTLEFSDAQRTKLNVEPLDEILDSGLTVTLGKCED